MAVRQLEKLRKNQTLLKNIFKALDEIEAAPNIGKELKGKYAGVRSYRVGEWRILYEGYNDKLIVLVIRIAKRSEVYR